MRYLAQLFFALYLSVGMICGRAAALPCPATGTQRPHRTERDCLRRDMAAWSRYVADDCIFSTDEGTLQTKAQFIEHEGKLPPSTIAR